jgi:hypothetical protein
MAREVSGWTAATSRGGGRRSSGVVFSYTHTIHTHTLPTASSSILITLKLYSYCAIYPQVCFITLGACSVCGAVYRY